MSAVFSIQKPVIVNNNAYISLSLSFFHYQTIEDHGETTIVIPSTSEILRSDLQLSSSSSLSSIHSDDSDWTTTRKVMEIDLNQGFPANLDIEHPSREVTNEKQQYKVIDFLPKPKPPTPTVITISDSESEDESTQKPAPTIAEERARLDRLIQQKIQDIEDFMKKFQD